MSSPYAEVRMTHGPNILICRRYEPFVSGLQMGFAIGTMPQSAGVLGVAWMDVFSRLRSPCTHALMRAKSSLDRRACGCS